MSDDALDLAVALRSTVTRLGYTFRTAAMKNGMTPTRLTALGMLERFGPSRPSDVAARLNIAPASMSRLTDVLERSGWINREDDPDDRRACLLVLNKQGKSALEQLRRDNARDLAALIRALPEDQVTALVQATPVLNTLTEELFDQRAGEGDAGESRRQKEA